jgi:hypothetical protein
MKKNLFFICLLSLGVCAYAQKSTPARKGKNAAKSTVPTNYAPPGTVIVPASSFLDRMPKGDLLTEARGDGWYFNNTAITLNSLTNLITFVNVPEAGKYYVYARSSGAARTGFKVVVNDKVTADRFGDTALTWKRSATTFDLKPGRTAIKITRLNPAPIFDVVVLSKNPNLKEDDIKSYQLDPDVVLLKEYHSPVFPGLPKFGDVDGDKKTDFLVLSNDFSATMFNNAGKELWSYKAPAENARLRSEFEAPGVIWDFDHDGKAEVVHWRFIDNKEWLVIANGETGDIIRKVEWPTGPLPHVYNNFRLAIAKLTKGAPNEIAVFTDYGGTINTTLYDSNLKLLWQHTEKRQKDNQGHYIYPLDINGDGIDEILVGSELLDAKGKEIWNRFDLVGDNHDHADSYKMIDMNHDGKQDIIISNSETGVYAIDGMTKKMIWQSVAEHSQQLDVGYFLKGVPGPQTVIGGRTYGTRTATDPYLYSQLYWFDNKGNLVNMWPHGFPLNGNPNFVSGDWKGDGKRQVFWYKFKLDDKGEGHLYFPDQVYHIFDFTGRGADEVITYGRGVMRVYGSKTAHHTGKDKKADLRYLQLNVANHTHY